MKKLYKFTISDLVVFISINVCCFNLWNRKITIKSLSALMFSHKITYKWLRNGKSDNIEMRFKAVIKGATLSIETVKTVFN